MRSMWFAIGVIVVVLALAVALRPGQRAGAGGGDADDGWASEPAAEVPPRPLAAEDVRRIMELRAEFGSTARWMGGDKVGAAAFEQELRQLAGLDHGKSTAQQAEGQASLPAASSPIGEGGASVEVLRQAAAALDDAANRSEESEDYGRADHLRSLSGQLRQLARRAAALSQESPPAAVDAADGLIDKSQARQAQ